MIEKLKLSSVSSAHSKITNKDLGKLSTECRNLDWEELSSQEKSLFVSEIYLRQRFSDNKDKEKALVDFVQSLNIQHTHELLRLRPSEASRKQLEKLSLEKEKAKTEESYSIEGQNPADHKRKR